MSNRLKITYLDGSDEETVASARAEVELERRFNVSFHEAFTTKARKEFLFYLGWAALKLSGKTSQEFDEWLEPVDDVDVVVDQAAKASDPTRPARRRGTSSA